MQTHQRSARYPAAEAELWASRTVPHAAERRILDALVDSTLSVLEGGVGGERLLASAPSLGVCSLYGFDQSSEASTAHRHPTFKLTVQDARTLAYSDAAFPHLIYLLQLLSLVGSDNDIRSAGGEAFRVLEPGGRALFSFLSPKPNWRSPAARAATMAVRLQRRLRATSVHDGLLPWWRVGGTVRWGALLDRPPHAPWFAPDEVGAVFEDAGFAIQSAAMRAELDAALPIGPFRGVRGGRGGLFVVCRRP